jgi:NodT family efflux transporter outer membrane factor (OMF) lipoprotein
VPGQVTGGWLRSFEAPGLEELVWEALRYNVDFQIAAARLEQAAGYARLAGAAVWPAVGIGGRASAGDGDTDALAGGYAAFSWELDLWGRVRAGKAAAKADYASPGPTSATRGSLAAVVVKSWFLATGPGSSATRPGDDPASAHFPPSNDRKRVGLGDDLEIAQAEASLAAAHDAAQRLDTASQQAVRALELLVGRYPKAELEVPSTFTKMPGPVPLGLPAELLERRPDVIAAERRVAAAFHRVKEAKAARLPRLTLSGNVSSVSSELFVLQNTDNPVWSLAGNLTMPIFDGGALQTKAVIRTLEQKEALARFAQVAVRAFGEAETALSEESSAETRAAFLTRAIGENEKALAIAETRYRIGSIDMRAVERQTRLAASAAQIEAERRVNTSTSTSRWAATSSARPPRPPIPPRRALGSYPPRP